MGPKLPKISDSLVDGLAIAGDTFLEIVAVLPVLGRALDIAKSIRSTADALFIRKLARFLDQLEDISAADRANFSDRMGSPEERERFQEGLLLLLDKLDETEKATVVGRLHRAAILNEITLDTAKRLSSIVNRSFYSDLLHLAEFHRETKGTDPDVAVTLRSVGLLDITREDGGDVGEPNSGGTYYSLNKYGEILVRFGFTKTARD